MEKKHSATQSKECGRNLWHAVEDFFKDNKTTADPDNYVLVQIIKSNKKQPINWFYFKFSNESCRMDKKIMYYAMDTIVDCVKAYNKARTAEPKDRFSPLKEYENIDININYKVLPSYQMMDILDEYNQTLVKEESNRTWIDTTDMIPDFCDNRNQVLVKFKDIIANYKACYDIDDPRTHERHKVGRTINQYLTESPEDLPNSEYYYSVNKRTL